jgi:hypothetical protein
MTSPLAGIFENTMWAECTIHPLKTGVQAYDADGQPVYGASRTSKCTIQRLGRKDFLKLGDVNTDSGTMVILPADSGFKQGDALEYEGSDGPVVGTVAEGQDVFNRITHIEVMII